MKSSKSWSLVAAFLVNVACQQAPQESAEAFSVQDTRGDPPAFERIYSAELESRGMIFTVKVRAKTAFATRMTFSELTQPGGRYVLFDARAVAEKIIDRDLAPKVQEVVTAILAADEMFVNGDPSIYVDVHGWRWVRQSSRSFDITGGYTSH